MILVLTYSIFARVLRPARCRRMSCHSSGWQTFDALWEHNAPAEAISARARRSTPVQLVNSTRFAENISRLSKIAGKRCVGPTACAGEQRKDSKSKLIATTRRQDATVKPHSVTPLSRPRPEALRRRVAPGLPFRGGAREPGAMMLVRDWTTNSLNFGCRFGAAINENAPWGVAVKPIERK